MTTLDFPLTKERPTKEGNYWFRGRLNGEPPKDWMCAVYEEQGEFYFRDRQGRPINVAHVDGEWNGPELWTRGYPCQHRVEGRVSGTGDAQITMLCLKCMRPRVVESNVA